jgi:hypothetical protein
MITNGPHRCQFRGLAPGATRTRLTATTPGRSPRDRERSPIVHPAVLRARGITAATFSTVAASQPANQSGCGARPGSPTSRPRCQGRFVRKRWPSATLDTLARDEVSSEDG